jgi:signal transduction histidine kinase
MPDNIKIQPTPMTVNSPEDLVTKEILAILGRLTATIAHDVRNPLGTINTSVFSIKTAIEKNQPERIERALKLAERNIRKCDQILAEFIDITQKVEINTTPVNIDAWIRGFFEEQTFPPGIECIQNFNSDYAVSIDPDKLRRALSNIIKNAIQAMKDNEGGKLTVQTSMEEGLLVISVSDTGKGIPDDILPRIYEPLFSSKRFGVGLGLTVTREIVEKHGGTITVESRKDSGTKVTLKIPAAPVE